MKIFKSILTLGAAFCLAAGAAFAQDTSGLPEYHIAQGNWVLQGDTLSQTDPTQGMARLNFANEQSGPMIYSFKLAYEGGAEDGQGGLGLHLFASKVKQSGKTWGSGKSILFWVNYDKNPTNPKIPAGLSAEVYRSVNNSYMELVDAVDLNYLVQSNPNFLSDYTDYFIPITLRVNGDTGEVSIYNDTAENYMNDTYYLTYQIPSKYLPLKGGWTTIRTNGLKASFQQ
jgi:hypothetical protein